MLNITNQVETLQKVCEYRNRLSFLYYEIDDRLVQLTGESHKRHKKGLPKDPDLDRSHIHAVYMKEGYNMCLRDLSLDFSQEVLDLGQIDLKKQLTQHQRNMHSSQDNLKWEASQNNDARTSIHLEAYKVALSELDKIIYANN